jgi:hypothetical protein
MFPTENSMLGWLYREYSLFAVTTNVVRFPVQPSESYDWVMERIQVQYDSNLAVPSVFQNIEWNIEFPQQNSNLTDPSNTVSLPLTLNPGIFDQTTVTNKPRVFYFHSPTLNWPLLSRQTFRVQLENFVGATLVRVLFIGHYILPEPVNA